MRPEIAFMIAGMTLVTFIPRFLPMALMSRLKISGKLSLFLEFVPVAVLSALVFPAVFVGDDRSLSLSPQLLVPAVMVLLFAHRTRNLWGSVVLGMAIYWLLSEL
ncbi:branched-chain amino acid transport [Dehalogenimonas lykanthroporepellens BL-DC-9]|nr:branched-chain amino acid transport [Dehalogenimonas lykanthroporepellens BL-DC-9]